MPSMFNGCNSTCCTVGVINQLTKRELLSKIAKIYRSCKMSLTIMVQKICMDSFSLKVIKSILLLLSRNV